MGLGSSLPRLTIEEVAAHNTMEAGVWLVAHGYVYDATPMLKEGHPGGEESILRRGGGVVDATQDYDFHSREARAKWKKNIVGVLVKNNK